MKKLGRYLLWALGGLWATFAFLASNSPNEVQERASGWMSLPLLRSLPTTVYAWAASPVVLSVTFLLVGAFVGYRLANLPRWQNAADDLAHLGVQMLLLAKEIEDPGPHSDLNSLNAKINLMRVKTAKKGLTFPKEPVANANARDLLPYLTHVGSYLKAGELDYARSAARSLGQGDA